MFLMRRGPPFRGTPGLTHDRQMVVWLSNKVKFLFETDEGVTAIEYSLISGLISIAIISALSLVGQDVQTTFDTWTGAVHDAVSNAGS